jgi:hypothetical protein
MYFNVFALICTYLYVFACMPYPLNMPSIIVYMTRALGVYVSECMCMYLYVSCVYLHVSCMYLYVFVRTSMPYQLKKAKYTT